MKKIIIFSFLFLLACDSENADTPVLGTWLLTEFRTNTPYDINNDGIATTNFKEESNCFNDTQLIFDSFGTVTFAFEEASIFISPSSPQNDPNYTVSCSDGFEDFTIYFQNGNNVTLGTIDDRIDATIEGNTMRMFVPDMVTIPLAGGSSQSIGGFLTFVKL